MKYEQQLAAAIRQQFTPFAFRCECGGENKDCAAVLSDPVELNIYKTVEKIARWLEVQA